MTTKELKEKIHNDINNLSDDNILEMMNMILDTHKNNYLKISDKHKKFLDESKNSKIYTEKETKELVDQWLRN